MGLIKAGLGAIGGVLADQWKEFFYCDSMAADVLVTKGKKQVSERSSNTKGDENIISSGSKIAVNDGQCMIIVESGKVAEICAEPGEFIYDKSTEPSIFSGNLGVSIIKTFKNIGKRFTFGGDTGKDQRVYYINTKEIIGNKYGTPSPVPFRVVDKNIGLDVDISIRCHGEYSYRITNPILFYTNVCGNVQGEFRRSVLDSQLKSELLTALQPAFARISEKGVRYSALPAHTSEIGEALNDVLSAKWRDIRGIEISVFGVSSVNASEEDENMIKELQRNATFRNPTMAAAHLVSAQAQAMQDAAKNEGGMGAMGGFFNMNMAQNAGNINTQSLYAMGQQEEMRKAEEEKARAREAEQSAKNAPIVWSCKCGKTNNTGKFCMECGEPKPADGWVCECGSVNKGKFCSECGKKKPEGAPLCQCDKCGWKPEDPMNPPKFCPECGDRFDELDRK